MTRIDSRHAPERDNSWYPANDSEADAATLASVLDLQALQHVQHALAMATGMMWELVDADGNTMTQPSGVQKLCELVRAEPSERTRCVVAMAAAGRLAQERGAPVERVCDGCGLVCILAPIVVAGRHLASWHCGQVRLGDTDPAVFDRLEASCGVSRNAIVALHGLVPVVNRERLDALASLAWHYAKGLSTQAQMSLQLRRDVGARHRAEVFLDEIINAIGDPVFVKDEEHRWSIVNHAFCRFMGWPREQLLGKSDFDFFPEAEAREFWEKDDQVFTTDEQNVNEERFTDSLGVTHIIVTTKTVFRRSDGSKYLVGVIRNITAQRQGEEELSKYRTRLEELVQARTHQLLDANEKLLLEMDERKRAEEGKQQAEAQLVHQQKLEAIGRLAGGVAHDFNNLLTGILGHVSLALREAPTEGRVFDSLSEIRNAAKRAADLTRQLLAFSRKQLIEPRHIDINQLIGNLQKLLARIIGEDVRLDSVLQAGLPPVLVDPGQIEQVVVNLVVNARDAMPSGGTLTIRTSLVSVGSNRSAEHAGAPPGDYVLLTVSDTGIGMDKETRDRIFEPFFTTKQRGTGLGLSTVYGIVQQHAGYIRVVSEPNQGTTFLVYLSAVEGVAESDGRGAGIPDLPNGTETLMLVEDEAIVRDVSRVLLSQLGYHVLVAANGEQALALSDLHPSRIDLLITDIVMPGMDGRELAAELQARRPSLRVLFTSGYTDDVIVRRGVLAKGVDFIAKPFSRELIAGRVREILDRT